MAAGSDQQARLDLAVDYPRIAGTLQPANWNAFPNLCSGAPEEVLVNLASPDDVANDTIVGNVNLSLSHAANAKAGDGLKGASARIACRIDFELLEDERRDPATAYFIAWEDGFIEDQNMQS